MKQLLDMKKTVEKDFSEVGDKAVDLIKKRTRLGYGVSDHGKPKKKLKKLSPAYIAARKKNKPKGLTSPSKSNLTNSGDMLDNLESKDLKNNKIEIGFNNSKDEKKAKWVSDDRPFNNLSKSELKQLKQLIDKSIKEAIKKNN